MKLNPECAEEYLKAKLYRCNGEASKVKELIETKIDLKSLPKPAHLFLKEQIGQLWTQAVRNK